MERGATVLYDVAELTDGIVDFGRPMIEIFDVTDEATEVALGDAVIGLPYSVVLAPMTMGIATVCVCPTLSVKAAIPVVVVVPPVESRLWEEGRLRLPMTEDGIGEPLLLQAAWKGAMIWLGSRLSSAHWSLMQEEAWVRKFPEPAMLQIPRCESLEGRNFAIRGFG